MPNANPIANRVRQTTTTTGTGALSLAAAPTGARGIVSTVGAGKAIRYKLEASNGAWEIGVGTATAGSPDTFARTTILENSLGTTAAISLPAGTHTLDLIVDARSFNEMTPRMLGLSNGVTLAAGVLTLDCMFSCDVAASVAVTQNITQIVLSNVPERCDVLLVLTQSGGPFAVPQSAWPAGTALETPYFVNTDTTPTRFWWTTVDGGTSSTLGCNAPVSISRSPAITAGAIAVDAAGIGDVLVTLSLTASITSIVLSNVPTACRLRFEVTQTGSFEIADTAWPSGTVIDPFVISVSGKTVITYETRDAGASGTVSGPTNGATAFSMVSRLFWPQMFASGSYFDQSLLGVAHNTAGGVAGRLEIVRFVAPVDISINQAGVNVTTGVAGALGRIVIYGANAAGEPGALLLMPADDLSLAATGFVSHTLTFTFKKNVLYYVGFHHSSTATISTIQGFSLPALGLTNGTTTSPFSLLRRTVTYPNAPASWGYLASDRASGSMSSVRMRVS